MDFMSALSEYHKGKRIRRTCWPIFRNSIDPKGEFLDYCLEWVDILATDWEIVEE